MSCVSFDVLGCFAAPEWIGMPGLLVDDSLQTIERLQIDFTSLYPHRQFPVVVLGVKGAFECCLDRVLPGLVVQAPVAVQPVLSTHGENHFLHGVGAKLKAHVRLECLGALLRERRLDGTGQRDTCGRPGRNRGEVVPPPSSRAGQRNRVVRRSENSLAHPIWAETGVDIDRSDLPACSRIFPQNFPERLVAPRRRQAAEVQTPSWNAC